MEDNKQDGVLDNQNPNHEDWFKLFTESSDPKKIHCTNPIGKYESDIENYLREFMKKGNATKYLVSRIPTLFLFFSLIQTWAIVMEISVKRPLSSN
jgi:hypothetical protein